MSSNKKGSRRSSASRNIKLTLGAILVAGAGFFGLTEKPNTDAKSNQEVAAQVDVQGSQYTTKDEVAKFICDNGYFPPN